ncbi:catechol-2,3-dioxygenase [Gemmatimonadetes bacterium T265]|nr:catechol-2,3-dioxygenase [Gemmatimonadetes bacterium T265]
MTTTTHDLFGDAAGAQPATPGSYGMPPGGYRLPASTRLGPVQLQVADLARSLAFYEGVLGFRTLARDDARVTLGAQAPVVGGEAPALVELVEHPGARPMTPGARLGLYHVAILLPDRAALGRFVRHLSAVGARAGAGDHHVSEAFYLHDPDGLGIEVYADRPRDAWRRVGRELMMATDPVDVRGLVRAVGDAPWTGMPAGTTVGHVHLHVGDVAGAAAFYAEGLGFDRTVWSYPGALFLSAGGYHHHLGTNTWAGPRAQAPRPDDARLLEWAIVLPDAADVRAAAGRLARAGHATEEGGGGDVVATDPWGTRVRLAAAAA